MEQRYVIRYLHRKKFKTEDIVKELKDVYGKNALTRSRVFYWIKEINIGREDLNDLPPSGRPIDEQLVATIQNHITNEQAKKFMLYNDITPLTKNQFYLCQKKLIQIIEKLAREVCQRFANEMHDGFYIRYDG